MIISTVKIYSCCCSLPQGGNLVNNGQESTNKTQFKPEKLKINLSKSICNDQNVFANELNKVFNTNFINDNELLNKIRGYIETNFTDLDYYYGIYKEMTEDIFNNEAAIMFISYLIILKQLGITDALEKILKADKVTYWLYYRYGYIKKNEGHNYIDIDRLTSFEVSKYNENDKIIYDINSGNYRKESNQGAKEYNNGSIFIDNTEFKFLRCSGCNNSDCVSCKLRNFLIKENLSDSEGKGKFHSFFYSLMLRKEPIKNSKQIVAKLLKNEYKTQDLSNIKSVNISSDDEKIFFIEWALTYEFLKRFVPIIWPGESLTLYKTYINSDREPEIKLNPLEKFSVFGPVSRLDFRPVNNFYFYSLKNVKYFRCTFFYPISSYDGPLLDKNKEDSLILDQELEIHVITNGLQLEKLPGENNKNEDHFNHTQKTIDASSHSIIQNNFIKINQNNKFELKWNEPIFVYKQINKKNVS